MSILSKLFGRKQDETLEQSEKNPTPLEIMENTVVKEDFQKEPENLPEALRFIVETRGSDFLLKRAFINILNDFHVIKDTPAIKHILENMLSNGYIERITSTSNWQLDSQNICKQYVAEFATQEYIVRFIIQSFGYGLNKITDIPIYSEPAESPSPQQQAFAQHTEKENNPQPIPTPQYSEPINPREPFLRYGFPVLGLLRKTDIPISDSNYYDNLKNRIVDIFRNEYKIDITQIEVTCSNIVDTIECEVAPGCRISRLKNAETDLAIALSPEGLRLQAPIPGTNKIGMEMPAHHNYDVSIESVFNSQTFVELKLDLPCFIGKKPNNGIFGFDLAKLPHLLISGATEQGKSMCIHDIMMSLLYKKHPNEVKFIMVDFKQVEFYPYEHIKNHFFACDEEDEYNNELIISNSNQALRTFQSLKNEFDTRFKMLADAGARNVKDYNEKFINRKLNIKEHEYLPYIVVVIDEYANLTLENKQELESILADLIQKGSSVGIHFIVGVNSSSVNIIDRSIMNNIKGRIALKCNSASESKMIIGIIGEEKLFAPGDAYFMDKSGLISRVQCIKSEYEEIDKVCEFIGKQPGPIDPYELKRKVSDKEKLNSLSKDSLDPYFEEAARAIVMIQQGSTAMIQRRFAIGYTRAGRLMDQLEYCGIVGPARGSAPRDVLIHDEATLYTVLSKINKL